MQGAVIHLRVSTCDLYAKFVRTSASPLAPKTDLVDSSLQLEQLWHAKSRQGCKLGGGPHFAGPRRGKGPILSSYEQNGTRSHQSGMVL